MANSNIKRLKAFKPVPPRDPVMGGGILPGFKGGKTPRGSTVAGSLPGFPNSPTTGSTQAGILTDFPGGGPVRGSSVAGNNMMTIGGPNAGSTFPNAMKGGSKPKGTSIPNEKLARFHATRGASKL